MGTIHSLNDDRSSLRDGSLFKNADPALRTGLLSLGPRGTEAEQLTAQHQLIETIRLIRRYQDTPMSFADACLVRMAELRDEAIILTTDTDFRIYRKKSRQVISLLIPER